MSAPPTPAERLVAAVTAELRARLAGQPPAGLHLVATPIGNLADITLRALTVIVGASELYCEDTRQTLKLLARYGIDRRVLSYHEHNAERERPRILARLDAGGSVALVSDAGTPLVSDPGYKLVRAAVEAGHDVFALPGPSAALAALTVAGLPTDSFHFAGFLPVRSKARRDRIAALATVPATLIVFETPSRLAAALLDLADLLGPRPAAVARELTKLHEQVRRGPLPELATWARSETLRGEIVLVIGPPLPRDVTDDDISLRLQSALAGGSLRDAVARVTAELGVARSRVYDLAVTIRHGTVGEAGESDE